MATVTLRTVGYPAEDFDPSIVGVSPISPSGTAVDSTVAAAVIAAGAAVGISIVTVVPGLPSYGLPVAYAGTDGTVNGPGGTPIAPYLYRAAGEQVKQVEGYGHSYMQGNELASPTTQRYLYRLAKLLDAEEINRGAGGTYIINDFYTQLTGPLARTSALDVLSDVYVLDYGINDLGAFGTTNTVAGIAAATRAAISRFRTGVQGFHPDTDAALAYIGSGWGTNATGHFSSDNGESFTWTTPVGFHGGWVSIAITTASAYPATFTFSAAGPQGSTIVSGNLNPAGGAPATNNLPGVFRFNAPPYANGVTTLTCTVSAITGFAAYVQGWQLESAAPPLVLVLGQPLLTGYGTYSAYFHEPTSADVIAMNAAVQAVCAEFGDDLVQFVNLDSLLNRATPLFLADLLHPGIQGNLVIANKLAQAIATNPHLLASAALLS
jgi:hypothetical protein